MSNNENVDNELTCNTEDTENSSDQYNLRRAVEDENLDSVKRSVEAKVDLNVMFQYDNTCGIIACDPPKTALMIAAERGNTEIVSCLLEAGADPLIVNDGRLWNALHYACSTLQLDTVKVLLENTKININLPDYNGYTPLLLAIAALGTANRKDTDIVHYLIEKGANVHLKNQYWADSLSLAKTYGLESVKKMIKANADVNSTGDTDNATSLITAAFHGNEDILSRLLKSGAKIDEVNENGNTALHEAVKQNQYKCIKRLLEAKAPSNVKNNDGKTPLMLAVVNESEKSVSYLLEAGADVTLQDNNGKTALEMCVAQDIKSLLTNRHLKFLKIS